MDSKLRVTRFPIDGPLLIEPRVFGDDRGYFLETWNERGFREATGLDIRFVQDNQSRSAHGVVRGLHCQLGEHAQGKLVRCVEGSVLDVAVDARPGSPTRGMHVAVELSATNFRQLWIPRGFLHGFAVTSPFATLLYKADNYYCAAAESGCAWDSPSLAIPWPGFLRDTPPVLSPKDAAWPPFE